MTNKSKADVTAVWVFGTLLVVGIIIVLTIWAKTNGVLAFLATIPLFPLFTGFIEAACGVPQHRRSSVRYVEEGDYEPESAMSRGLKRAGRTAAVTGAGFALGYKLGKKTEL